MFRSYSYTLTAFFFKKKEHRLNGFTLLLEIQQSVNLLTTLKLQILLCLSTHISHLFISFSIFVST